MIYKEHGKIRLHLGMPKVKKACKGSVQVYSSGNVCTYHVDTGITYQEEVDEGASCLAPVSFAPAKSGWVFAGWRRDTAASGDVLGSLEMGDEPVTLYAVFKQTITLSYNGNGSTGGSTAAQTGYRYYNNGNVVNPGFSVKANEFTRSGHIFTGWKFGGTAYAVGQSVTLSASLELAAQWHTTSETWYYYNGGIQTYTVPTAGLYLLTCYGAQGENGLSGAGGRGGMAKKYVQLTAGTVLYIVCGGQADGYNGGGKYGADHRIDKNGGGATHIATASGLLASLGNTSRVLAIAGGGGGGGSCTLGDGTTPVPGAVLQGGRGGGTNGVDGITNMPNYGISYGRGGTQSGGGSGQGESYMKGSFGRGGQGSGIGGSGGGGGLYGGGGGGNYNGASPGGGGSGWIGTATTTYKDKTYTNETALTSAGGGAGNGSAAVQLIAT